MIIYIIIFYEILEYLNSLLDRFIYSKMGYIIQSFFNLQIFQLGLIYKQINIQFNEWNQLVIYTLDYFFQSFCFFTFI